MTIIENNLLNKVTHSTFEAFLPRIPNESVDVLFTDPPYNIAIAEWDYDFQFVDWLNLVIPKVKNDGLVMIWNTKEIIDKRFIPYFKNQGWIVLDSFNWGKTNPRPSLDLYRIFEHLFIAYKTKEMDKFNPDEYILNLTQSEVWISQFETTIYKNDVEHETKKPVKLLEKVLLEFTSINDIVLDTTSGSGSIPVACWATHRQFLACEMDKKHAESSNKRLMDVKKDISRSIFLF